MFFVSAVAYAEMKCPESAIECWHERAVVCEEYLRDPLEAAESLLQAGQLRFSTEDMAKVVELYRDGGRFTMAADALCTLAASQGDITWGLLYYG